MSSIITGYNPDVLSCLANLSNDEVFTPPEVANAMLDMLPQELFSDPNAKFLDPACKSGVFLREIAKRCLEGQLPGYRDAADEIDRKKRDGVPLTEEEKEFQERLQETIDHIFHNQVFGIAITELTSLLSRRSLYCTKYPNSEYSVTRFDDQSGNIRYKRIKHRWKDGKCIFCGASEKEYARSEDLETHAYEFIHTAKPRSIFDMKFDVIIGNPPYHLSDSGNGSSAKPIYQEFVEQAKLLNPRFLTMIIPSRWFNGGKGLDKFRSAMLSDRHITRLVDYQNAKDCFPGVSLGGGVCYFLRERDTEADCVITNILGEREITLTRALDQFPVFVRYNDSIDIIRKVQEKKEQSVVNYLSSRNPFGIPTNSRGSEKAFSQSIRLYSSQGVGYIEESSIPQGTQYVDKYKIMISRVTSEHAGEPDKSGMYKVIAKMQVLEPGEVCTDSYILACPTKDKRTVDNFYSYLKTKFVRFLLMQALSSINLARDTYVFVPTQDFSKSWTDEELYSKYGLNEEEIAFIESMIKPME